MIPVLALRDPGQAKRVLRGMFGFAETAPDRMALGDQAILLCDIGTAPAGLVDMPFDHLALSVTSADEARDDFSARGAELDPDFTPDGPVEIPEFWSNGVRFVFFRGPGRAPFEFCQKFGEETGPGHSHYGIRTPMLDDTEAALQARGATRIARHLLPGDPPVEVRFLALGDRIFELFDAPPLAAAAPDGGWIGFIED